MPNMRNVLYTGSAVAGLLAALRAYQDGPGGELITALTLLAACVLLSGGAIVEAIDRDTTNDRRHKHD